MEHCVIFYALIPVNFSIRAERVKHKTFMAFMSCIKMNFLNPITFPRCMFSHPLIYSSIIMCDILICV